MSAKARDVIKTQAARIAEVAQLQALKAGQANSQAVLDSLLLGVGTTTTRFKLGAGFYSIGQALVHSDLQDNVVILAGTDTAAGQFRKVLVEINAAGVVSQISGAVVTTQQSDAPLPLGSLAALSVGWLELPPSFVVGTTVVTAGMLKQMPYWGQ